ncbi:hypothetical protein TNCV_3295901 [Trichonephila clavipes]|uniref:Uncharacterized protein n=1 Tax=Trichonephila clavipes TaxID=2585209 RepID=A0A8X6T168_TRICX|nr:hypothetical protein TNCV_3295901 [Trichonephila clavipes]
MPDPGIDGPPRIMRWGPVLLKEQFHGVGPYCSCSITTSINIPRYLDPSKAPSKKTGSTTPSQNMPLLTVMSG